MRTQEQTVVTRDTKSRSYRETQQSISCPRTLPQQDTCVRRETDTAVELPPAAPPRPPPSNFIYTTFVSCVGWLLRILFCWRSSDVGKLTPSLRSNEAPAPQELEQLLLRRHSPAPSAPTDPNPLPDWRRQMLMERRKKEADRAQHNRSIVVTFSGPARLNVELGVLENSRAGNRKQVCDLSEDEDGGRPPLPFVFSGPESVCETTVAPCCPIQQVPPLLDCPGPRCPSSCSSNVAWDDSASDADHTSTSSTEPTEWEEDELDEEECTAVISLIYEQD